MSISIICINDKEKPAKIPKEKWIKEGEWYTLDFIAWCVPQKCQGFGLKEVYLDESCKPYEYYKSSRFGVKNEDLEEFIQMCKDFTGLNDLDLSEIIKETEVEVLEEF